MPDTQDVSPGATPATTSLGETRRHSAPYREAVRQARQLLAAQEAARRERRERRWAELAVQLLAAQHAQGVEDVSEERLFVLAYEVVRGDRSSALSTDQATALRAVTRRVWSESWPIGADGRPDYFAIGAKLARAEFAMLPVDPAPATCCDTPRIVTITCPKCEGDAYRPVRVSVGDPPEDAECPRCEGTGTILACDTCDTEVPA